MRLRKSSQLKAIQDVIGQSLRPLSAEEILGAARKKVPSLGIATVYRTVRSLEESKWLSAHEIPGHKVVYERAELEHHHHFVCDRCERVFDVPGCVKDLKRLVPKNFVLESHEIILKGYCEDCH